MRRRGTRSFVITCAAMVAVLAPVSARPGVAHAAPPAHDDAHRFVTVMTRNMDEGTDFGYIASPSGLTLPQAAVATYLEVVASNVCDRARQIADEIAATQPDLVSLQEVARWTGFVPGVCTGTVPTTTIDAKAALLDELARDGAPYVVVKEQDEFNSSTIPGLAPLSFLDRDVLLARAEPLGRLSLSNATSAHFSTILPLTVGPVTVPILRGWISVDATLRGRTVRVIATHLESFYEPVQVAQAMEIAAGPANTTLPVILAGDLNTGPGSDKLLAYGFLTNAGGGGFTDTWSVTRPNDPGFTDSYYTEDPLVTGLTPSERIDLVLVRGDATPVADALVGNGSAHPSDHAGVVAMLRIPS